MDLDANDLRTLIWARRTGKTDYVLSALCEDGIPGQVHPFVGPTITQAQDLLLPKVEEYRQKHGVDFQIRGGTEITTPRGVIIKLFGLGCLAHAQKLRGGSYPMAVFDECGVPDQDILKKAVLEFAQPACNDWYMRGGRGIILSGTPGPIPEGFFFETCQGGFSASVHRATIYDNPFFDGRADAVLKKTLFQNKWTESTPQYRREHLAEWCLDSEGLCYAAWDSSFHDWRTLPEGYTVLAIDLGYNDSAAFVVVRFVPYVWEIEGQRFETMRAYVLEAFEQEHLTYGKIAKLARGFQKKWHVVDMVGDSGGGGLQGIETMRAEHSLPIQPVVKGGYKRDRIWNTNSQFGDGSLFLCCDPGAALVHQIRTVVWNETRDDHHERCPDHSCDALHYAIGHASLDTSVRTLPPEPGSEAWKRAEADRRKREALRRGR